jgi:hypothetical protein
MVAFRLSRILIGMLLLMGVTLSFSQVNYDAGRNLKDWTTTGDYIVDSHEWFGDTLVLSSTFRYVFDTIQEMQGDSLVSVVRYGSAQGVHLFLDEYAPASINIIDTAFIAVTAPVRYKGKMYWGGQKSFTPPDTSSWIVLYEFDPRTLGLRTLTLHDADAGFHYMHNLEIRGGLLSAITRAGIDGDRQYYMNIVDPTRWRLLAQAQLEWTTGSLLRNTERMLSSDVQVIAGDTTVVFSGLEDDNSSADVYFFKFYNLQGQELATKYTGDVINNFSWLPVHRNYDRSILSLRSDSSLFFLANHIHFDYEADSTSSTDFKAYAIDPFTFEPLDSSDIGDPNFAGLMQAIMDYTTVGDTLVAVGQCGWTFTEDDIRHGEPGYQQTFYQLGVVAYDMNTLELLWAKRIIAETEFGSLSDEYGITSSPHNFVSATAMTYDRNPIDNSFDTEVRIIHLNEHGCPTVDPDKTCDDLIFLDQFVSDTDDPTVEEGVVPSLQVVPSLLRVGTDNQIRFDIDLSAVATSSGYTVELFDNTARQLDHATLSSLDASYALPSSLTAGIYYAYLRSSTGASIGVGKFVVQ